MDETRKANKNLKPIKKGELTSEEAKKRGRAGGVKSGEARRAKRDAKEAMRYILGLPVRKEIKENMKKSANANAKDGLTNMEALQARLFTRALSGDLAAYEMVMKIAGYDPEEVRRERESINADRRRDDEVQFKKDAIASRNMDNAEISVGLGDEDGNSDVTIYLPEIANPEDLELPEEEEEEGSEEGK